MSVTNRSLSALIVCLVCMMQPTGIAAEEAAVQPSSVQIEFPIGDISIRYIESLEGMVLIAQSGPVTVQGRRLHFGNGKTAVAYAATSDGFHTPTGRVNAAGLEIPNGTRIVTQADKIKRWGQKAGEVYILVPNLKLETKKVNK